MKDITKIPLISTEITGLWNSYISDTMLVCVLKFYLNRVEDNETHVIMKQTLDLLNKHVEEVTNIFNKEKLTLPEPFDDNDINMDAPRLFTDSFYLDYLSYMARVQMSNYTLILNQIARSDMRSYFAMRINEYIDLYNNSSDLRLSKGIFIRAPRVEVNKDIQYVKSQSFLTDLIGEKRPLLTSEITHIFANIFSELIGRAVTTAFGQVSKDKKVSSYFFEGKTLSTEHISELTSILTDEGIPIPSSSDSFVTDSTIAPFSEKLMINHLGVLSSSGISNLCISMADTLRSDLEETYMKYLLGTLKYRKKGSNIMIEKSWLQQPPQAVKHENLVGV
jgi:hypothetical protein